MTIRQSTYWSITLRWSNKAEGGSSMKSLCDFLIVCFEVLVVAFSQGCRLGRREHPLQILQFIFLKVGLEFFGEF